MNTSTLTSLELGSFELDFNHRERFKFFSCKDIFSDDSYSKFLERFDDLPWEKKDSHFYSQYSAKILLDSPAPFSQLYHSSFFIPFKTKVEQFLGTSLRNNISIVAHRLVSSQEIGVHNDYTDPELGYENYRFIFQFSSNPGYESGGELYFLASENKKDVIKEYPYCANMGICFQISPYSYHCVAPVKSIRHTLVMNLWDSSKKYDGSGVEIF